MEGLGITEYVGLALLAPVVIGGTIWALVVLVTTSAARHREVGARKWLWLALIMVGWLVIIGWMFALLYLIVVWPKLRRPPTASAPVSAPGWYPDPSGTGPLRWWDGRQWSDHVT